MLKFIIQKLLNKKWMALSLFLGNVLLIAIACANPMYSQAVLQRALVREMRDYLISSNQHPGTIVARNSFSPLRKDKNLAGIQATEDMLRDMQAIKAKLDELGRMTDA